MHIRSIIVISGAVVLMAATAALSKDGVPKIDLEKQCKRAADVADALTATKNPNAFDTCVKNEQSAREKLVQRWATIPAPDKANCIHSTQWSPSYLEWLGCLDTKDQVRTMREKSPESAKPLPGVCPIVNWQSNGEITGIVACQLR